jgi:hypothetical protein
MNGRMMKQNITAILAAWAFGLSALAAPQAEYINTGTVTNIPEIDAISFYNEGDFVTVRGVLEGEDGQNKTQIPYATHDTLYYTNSGASAVMLGQPGFLFEDLTTSGAHNASSFYNTGTITAVDTQTEPEFYTIGGGSFTETGTGVAYPSQVLIMATNVFNGLSGTINVGADGLLEMYGTYVTNNYALVAGDLTGNDTNDVTSIDQNAYIEFVVGSSTPFAELFTAPPTFFDLWWGITNVTGAPNLLDLVSVAGGETPPVDVTIRDVGAEGVPDVSFAHYAIYAYSYSPDTTNIYYNIVCVNTNFVNTNISAHVSFTSLINDYFDLITVVNPEIIDPNGLEAVVQFSVPCQDVISGQPATNSIYLLDGGAIFSNSVTQLTNVAWTSGYARPGYFEVSTETPSELASAFPGTLITALEFRQLIYPGLTNTYAAFAVPYDAASYAVQVGWDPEILDGVFPFTDANSGSDQELAGLAGQNLDIPDPTAEPARIDIEGTQLDLTDARIRAEGLVTLMATNLGGGATAGVDWGMANASLGATSGSLLISNIFPQSFTRLRGDLFAWSANWHVVGTNAFATNTMNFHLLVVDQSLQGRFNPTVRNLALTGTRSVDVEDPMAVINQALFQTTSLTINSAVHLAQNASSFVGSNAPALENLLINTNGVLTVDNVFDLGLDPTKNQISPVNRQYTIASIADFGQIVASTPLLQSAFFENDGGITTSNGGSMTIEAETLDMGLILTNTGQTNFMKVDGNLILSAVSIGVTNSTIITGYSTTGASPAGSLKLQTTSGGQIADFVPDTPATNNVLNNFWQVTDGFSLPVKPATGDLYGTEIKTIATNTTIALHTWAGAAGFSNVADGFVDNVVIGHLILSWQSTNALLHFTGVGAQNAMYVDYLEFDANSLYNPSLNGGTNYHSGLVIETNLTIYFAGCNFDDPTKLTQAYPNRLVWVTNFWGPNSTRFVTNELVPSQVCAVNASLADDSSQDTNYEYFPGTQNSANPAYPLNNPVGEAFYYGANGCPSNPVPAETVVNPFVTLESAETWAQTQLTTESSESITNLTNNLAARQPFAPYKGAYNGLFFGTNQLSPTNSGFFTFTLSGTGTFTGRLLMGPATYSFSGSGSSKFSTNTGQATAIAKHGGQSLIVNLQLADTSDGTTVVLGSVSNETWAAQLEGDRDAWSATNQAISYTNRYTMVLTNGGSNSVSLPGGDSYGTLAINKLGVLSVAGKLADGKAFSQSVPISEDGYWPFYTYVAGGKDFLLGWVYFQRNDSTAATRLYTIGSSSQRGTNIFWSKTASSKDLYYPAGFATNAFVLAGFAYVNPGKIGGFTLPDPTNTMVILGGGGLFSTNSTNTVAYNGKLMYSDASLTLSFNQAAGSFTGKFQSPEGGEIKMNGVAVQSPVDGTFTNAFGFFLGADGESGPVILQSQ